mgnify:CR=1 FL=1
MAKRSNFLDMLRALAIIFVVFSHYFHTEFPGASIGVSVFFALSGYLITQQLIQERRPIGWSVIWRFWVRRFLRVYPAFFVAAMVNLLLMAVLHNPQLNEFVTALPGMLTFRGAPWLGMGTGVFWTLNVEFWFYICVPIVVLVFGKGWRLFAALSALAVFSIAALFGLTSHLSGVLPGGSFPWMNELIFGALAAVAIELGLFERFRTPTAGQFHSVSWISFGVLLTICLFVSNDSRAVVWPLEATVASLVAAAWILTWARSDVDLAMSPLIFLGKISYSVYLVHAIPLDYFGRIYLPPIDFLALSKSWVVIAGAVICAMLMHYFIERPAMRFGRRLTRERKEGGSLIAARPIAALPIKDAA